MNPLTFFIFFQKIQQIFPILCYNDNEVLFCKNEASV